MYFDGTMASLAALIARAGLQGRWLDNRFTPKFITQTGICVYWDEDSGMLLTKGNPALRQAVQQALIRAMEADEVPIATR